MQSYLAPTLLICSQLRQNLLIGDRCAEVLVIVSSCKPHFGDRIPVHGERSTQGECRASSTMTLIMQSDQLPQIRAVVAGDFLETSGADLGEPKGVPQKRPANHDEVHFVTV